MSIVETSPAAARWEPLFRKVREQRSSEPAAVGAMREAAFARFVELGFPLPTDEEWRLTPLAPISAAAWESGRAGAAEPAAIAPWRIEGASIELVFVDGHLDLALSNPGAVPGVTARTLGGVLASPDGELGSLGELAHDGIRPFVALNTAMVADGAWITVERGAAAGIIHLVFFSTGGSRAIAPRVVVRAESGAQVTLVETHTGEGRYFTNAVTEIDGGEGSVIDHYRIIAEGVEGFHVGTVQVRQQRDCALHSRLIGLGGPLTRTDLATVLDGEGASCTLDGLYLTEGSEHFDAHTRIDHAKPHTDSIELYKGVLADSSRGVFNGLVIVRPDAQKITARQTNKNLLLSNDAIADSNPQLEIHANDVKCNHGSTIGQLDPTSLFYLRSRGIGVEQARAMLTRAFAGEVIDRMKVDPVRRRLERELVERLAGGAS